MPSGTHNHLKRLHASSHWGLEKTGGTFAVKMLPGAHNKSISIPLRYILTRFLKVAKTSKEVSFIMKQSTVLVNNKVIEEPKTPVGLFDVVTIKKTNEHYRLLFNVHKKLFLNKISAEEAKFRLTKVRAKETVEGTPYTRTLDGYNFRFVDPSVEVNDTVKVDIRTNKIVDHIGFKAGNVVFVYGGTSAGRVGVITRIETLQDGVCYVYLKDTRGKTFETFRNNTMVIGTESALWITLDSTAGIRLDEYELSNAKYGAIKEVEVASN